MYLNRLIFPAPHSSYTARTLKEQLHWIQRPACTTSPNPKQQNPLILDDKKQDKDIESGKKTTLACTEIELSREICFSGQNLPKEIQSPKELKELNLDVENREFHNFYDYYGTRTSLNDLVMRQQMKSSGGKRKKQNVGCFCFFSRAKSDPAGGKPDIGNSQTVGNNRRHKRTKSARYKETPKGGSSSQENSRPAAVKELKMVSIPCLYIKSNVPTKKTMLFFHGNGEDIYLSSELLRTISEYLLVNVLAVEYPGYGIYKGSPSEKNVLLDAEAAYNYLLNEMHCNEEDIFVAGRSIGSGPATWLASKKNPGMLILVSPFTSIKAVVKNNFGNTAQYFIKERFNNLENIPSVKCPVFILHGKKDTLIPEVQAMALYDAVKGKKRIYVAEEMDHGAFDFIEDLIVPLEKYMLDLNESVHSEEVLSLEAVLQGFVVATP